MSQTKVAYEPDLSQAENRIVAYVAQELSMMHAFETGRDVHRLTAGLIFNKDPAEVTSEDYSCSLGSGRYSERFWGKKANHSLNYGFGYGSFAIMNEMPEREAKMIVERYHQVYPAIRNNYHASIKRSLQETRRLTNLFGGRVRTFLGDFDYQTMLTAYAFIPQSTVADIINERGLLYMYHNQELFHDVDILNQVHDSIWLQIPLNTPWNEHAVKLLALKHSLEPTLTAHGRNFVIPVDAKLGPNFGPRVLDKTGRTLTKGLVDFKFSDDVDILAGRLEEAYIASTS